MRLVQHWPQSKKNQPILLFPMWSALISPVLTASAWPTSFSASLSTSCCPTLFQLPSRVSLSSDLERHRHLLKAVVLPENAELSQSPCSVQPSVPLFLWFSHHWTWKPHGSRMGAPLQCLPNPKWSHKTPCTPAVSSVVLWWNPRQWVSTLNRIKKWYRVTLWRTNFLWEKAINDA